MEIHALKIVVTEADLNGLLVKHLPEDHPLEELRLRVQPEGLVLQGSYPLFLTVRFETLWELSIEGGKVRARLSQLKAMGVPGTVFKSTVLKLLAEAVRRERCLRVEEEAILVDVDHWLEELAAPTRTNLRAIACDTGRLILEGGI